MEETRHTPFIKALDKLSSREVEDTDTEALSEMYLEARQLEEKIVKTFSAPLEALKKRVAEAEKASLPIRQRAKGIVVMLSERLDAAYTEVEQAIEVATKEALQANDMESLQVIPDRPELAEGITFAEMKNVVITDITEVPWEFLTPDMKAIKAALARGVEVPGTRLDVKRSWRKKKEEK